jgi:hypothetical protein
VKEQSQIAHVAILMLVRLDTPIFPKILSKIEMRNCARCLARNRYHSYNAKCKGGIL